MGSARATVDFCEENYHRSAWLAEYYNAWSSLWFTVVAVYCYCVRLHRADMTQIPRSPRRPVRRTDPISILYMLLGLIGLGSFVFHGTLQPWAQGCDEIPMLLLIQLSTFVVLCKTPRLYRAGCDQFHFCIMWCLYVCATVYVYVQSRVFLLFFVLFVSNCAILSGTIMVYLSTTDRMRTLQRSSNLVKLAVYIAIAFSCWLVDRMCLPMLRNINFHIVWHILSAHGATHLIAFVDSM